MASDVGVKVLVALTAGDARLNLPRKLRPFDLQFVTVPNKIEVSAEADIVGVSLISMANPHSRSSESRNFI